MNELSETSIRKQLLSEALQHPATLIPLGLAGLAAILLIAIAPFQIPALWAIILLITSLIAAAGSFFWIYSLRHDVEYERMVQEILRRQDKEDRKRQQASIEQLREGLRAELSAINSEAGLKALNDLNYEYDQLQLVLKQQDDTASMSVAHIPGLAEETYRQGLNVVSNGLTLARAVHVSNREKLENEVVELEKEIETLRKDSRQEKRVKIREQKLATCQELLELLNQKQYRVDELFYQCDRCKASLSITHLELASLQAGRSETSVSAVTESLQRTIDQAKEVQEEMSRLGLL